MNDMLRSHFNKALRSELDGWRLDNIISVEQAEELLRRYPEVQPVTASRLIAIAMNIGAVMTGLGSLLFVAANWEGIAAPIKLALIFLSIVISSFAGWKLKFEPGNHPRLGTALLILASMFYGAGIWLVSQVFNFDIELSQGLFLWGLGTAASAYVCESSALGMMATILLSSWSASSDLHHFSATQQLTTEGIFPVVLSTGISLFLGLKNRSAWAISMALGSVAFWISFNRMQVDSLGIYGTLLLAAYLWNRDERKIMERPLLFVGAFSVLISLLSSTFKYCSVDQHDGGILSCLLIVIEAIVIFFCQRREGKLSIEMVALPALALTTFALPLVSAEVWRLGFANILLALTIGGMLWSGAKRINDGALVNIAVGFAVLDILLRYFDMFFSMMDRSLFFVAGGFILMATAAFAERSRRKLLGGWQ